MSELFISGFPLRSLQKQSFRYVQSVTHLVALPYVQYWEIIMFRWLIATIEYTVCSLFARLHFSTLLYVRVLRVRYYYPHCPNKETEVHGVQPRAEVRFSGQGLEFMDLSLGNVGMVSFFIEFVIVSNLIYTAFSSGLSKQALFP